MRLHTLTPAPNSTTKIKRIGRGQGSGRGGTSTKGHKGAKARTGYNTKLGFEGGQMPLQRRVPKFGFNNIFKIYYNEIDFDVLNQIIAKGVSVIDKNYLYSNGYCNKNLPIKLLNNGKLLKSVTINIDKASQSAINQIKSIGGEINFVK